MENIYDFQVGDPVTCLQYGEGVIVDINTEKQHPIRVKFKVFQGCTTYTYEGCERPNKKRILYHGHDLKITVEEKRPVRWPWTNVYKSPERVWAKGYYSTEADARKEGQENPHYSHAISLEPPGTGRKGE